MSHYTPYYPSRMERESAPRYSLDPTYARRYLAEWITSQGGRVHGIGSPPYLDKSGRDDLTMIAATWEDGPSEDDLASYAQVLGLRPTWVCRRISAASCALQLARTGQIHEDAMDISEYVKDCSRDVLRWAGELLARAEGRSEDTAIGRVLGAYEALRAGSLVGV